MLIQHPPHLLLQCLRLSLLRFLKACRIPSPLLPLLLPTFLLPTFLLPPQEYLPVARAVAYNELLVLSKLCGLPEDQYSVGSAAGRTGGRRGGGTGGGGGAAKMVGKAVQDAMKTADEVITKRQVGTAGTIVGRTGIAQGRVGATSDSPCCLKL